MNLNSLKHQNLYLKKNNLQQQLEILTKMASDSTIYHKHAAALISGNTIYSAGINKFIKEIKNNNNIYKRTMHAEINVFENFPKKNVKGLDILVIRINKNYVLKNSRPCNQCIEKLKKIGIRRVYYSDHNGNIIYEKVEYMEKLHVSSGTLSYKSC
jgi:deoxycytidylate deaminase